MSHKVCDRLFELLITVASIFLIFIIAEFPIFSYLWFWKLHWAVFEPRFSVCYVNDLKPSALFTDQLYQVQHGIAHRVQDLNAMALHCHHVYNHGDIAMETDGDGFLCIYRWWSEIPRNGSAMFFGIYCPTIRIILGLLLNIQNPHHSLVIIRVFRLFLR